MKEIKIAIPNDCKLVKVGKNLYEIKRDNPPRTWKDFCENYPIKSGESYIEVNSDIFTFNDGSNEELRLPTTDKNYCTSKEEAQAFLALIQLRQLRKAWVEDFNPTSEETFAVIVCNLKDHKVKVNHILCSTHTYLLTFPNIKIAEDFLSCFRDLCETAKILL